MNFRNAVKALCKERGIGQKELAAKLGITPTSLSQSLKGSYPQLQTLEKIAKALNVEVVDLFEPNNGELTALVDYNGELHRFDNIAALEKFIGSIKKY